MSYIKPIIASLIVAPMLALTSCSKDSKTVESRKEVLGELMDNKPIRQFETVMEGFDGYDSFMKESKVQSSLDSVAYGDVFKKTSLAEMREIPAEKLVKTEYSNTAMTVDGYAITEQPYLTYERGANNEQALLNGFNSHEANVFYLFIKVDRDGYTEMLKETLGDYADDAEAIYPYDSIPLDYSFAVEAGGEAKGAYNYVLGGTWFAYSHYLWSNYTANEGIPVYQYCFTKDNRSLRANHAGELPYAYGNLWRHGWLYDEADYALSEAMQSYWVNFVKTGNPNGEGLPEWQPFAEDRSKVLELGDEIRMIDNPYNDLYPLLDKYQNTLK